jgi:diguanylate cyclase (GGDEF)-like protein
MDANNPAPPPTRSVKSRLFTGLRARLITLVLLAVTPAFVLILYSTVDLREQAEAQTLSQLQRVATLAARTQEQLIHETRQLLSVIAKTPQVRPGNDAACGSFLSTLLKQFPRYTNLGVASPDGNIFCSALPLKAPVNITDRLYFREAVASRRFAVGEYQIGRISGKASLNFGYPLPDSSDRVQSVIFAAIDLAWLNQLAADAQLPENSALTMIDRNGAILSRYPDADKWIGRSIRRTDLFNRIRAHGNGVMRVPGEDKIERLYAFTTLRENPGEPLAYLNVGIPSAVAYARVNELLFRGLMALGVVTLLTLAIAWIGSEAFVLRRVGALLAAVRRVAAGDLTTRSQIASRDDEIGELSSAFDNMAENLERRDRQIREDESRIARLNRIYALLSSVNGAVIRIRERDTLLQEACRIAVDEGRFRLACISLADPETLRLVTAYATGDGATTGRDIGVRLTPNDAGAADPVGAALYAGKSAVVDLAKDPRLAPDQGNSPRHRYRSCALLPLVVSGGTIGCLQLFAEEKDYFNDQEMKLLDELAADISLGLSYIEKADKLHSLVYYDVLTGLPNRVLFHDRLEQSLARARHHGRHVAVMSLYVDRLKEINSIYGQHVGDILLRESARRLRGLVREGDTVARASSSAFNIVLADVAHTGDVIMIARKIVDAFVTPVVTDGAELFVSVRIGIAVYPDDGDNIEAILKSAEVALNISQRETGSTYRFYTPEINVRATERFEIERDLRHALERGELDLHYQPVVDIKTRKIIGCEALLRWNNATLGAVSPARFIPVAEETGLIVPIGEWVLKTACRQGLEWRDQGLPMRMSVNVSAKQLRREDFPQAVLRILKETGFNPSAFPLTMEITESELMENAEQSATFLKDLQERGLSVSIDDFGTGYSSLSYLKRMPVDTLKIDISFVRDITNNHDDPAIVKAIIALAHSLNMNVVAEGVETRAQFETLRALGCDAVQGFLFSPAVPAADFAELCKRPFSLPPDNAG